MKKRREVAQSKYVYGVIDTDEEIRFDYPKSTKFRDVYTISYQDVACVVSDYPEGAFDYGTREEVARKLVSHQTVIETIMKEHTILPFKFGTLLENSHDVRRVLEKGYREFKDRLQKIKKKIELDVAAFWSDLNAVIQKIGEEDLEIKTFKEEITKRSPEDTFRDRIKIGSMIKDVLDKKREILQVEMIEYLTERIKIDEFKIHELLEDKLILNCAFLLDKGKEGEFEQVLNEMNASYKEEINFKIVGPLPLYSFFTYEVSKVDLEEIERARRLLELDEEVDSARIKAAYRRLIREKHPDKHPETVDAQKKFEEIQSAYRLLLDYSQDEKKSLRKEDVEGTYIIRPFDVG